MTSLQYAYSPIFQICWRCYLATLANYAWYSDTRKFDHGLSLHTELHWLDVPERINYKLGMLMYRCQHGRAPRRLVDHCTSVSDVAYRQRLRSASSHKVLFHGTGSVPMDVGHLPLLARLSGTLCPRTCVIRMFLRTVAGSH